MTEEEIKKQINEQTVTNKKFLSVDTKQMTHFLDLVKSFFKDKNNSGKVVLGLAVVVVGLAVYLSFRLYSTIQDLRVQTPELPNLSQYDTSVLYNNRVTKEALSFSTTFYDLIKKDDEIKQDIQKYTVYMQNLQLPYENFLKYVYLPSLNIRKNVYTKQIDTDLIGDRFLKENPYNDVVLFQKWSDFFKNVGDNNEFNEISDITIGSIVETADGYFSIPVTVSFVATSKRSFLLLVDKLSLTSNKNNISLMNEFFYYLWQEIKKQKPDQISGLVISYSSVLGTGLTEDAYMGYALYDRIFGSGENVLIDDAVLEGTIKNLMFCNDLDMAQCYYQFREKYRDISLFAYAISKDLNQNVVGNFKAFFATLPSIIALRDFTFDKVKPTDLGQFEGAKYQGNITIDIYGRGIPQEDIDQIALTLGQKCFGEEKAMSIEEGLSLVDQAITQQSEVASSDRSKTDDLWDLKNVMDVVIIEYPTLPNFKKIVRLFETWRMLMDAGLCQ